MKWLNTPLRTVWHTDDLEDIYKVTLEVYTDWKEIADKLGDWERKFNFGGNYDIILGDLIHEGNRYAGDVHGRLVGYEKTYELDLKWTWVDLQKLLFYVRNAEVLDELLTLKFK